MEGVTPLPVLLWSHVTVYHVTAIRRSVEPARFIPGSLYSQTVSDFKQWVLIMTTPKDSTGLCVVNDTKSSVSLKQSMLFIKVDVMSECEEHGPKQICGLIFCR